MTSCAPRSRAATSPPVSSQRLDAALAARGLARSRTHAATLIDAGFVRVAGKPVAKPSVRVDEGDVITVDGADHYVSRAAHKLIAGLDGFHIEVRGRSALDVGASTGGFSQVLLERGAEPVVALDVGHGQLSPRIRSDERVVVIEGVNAKSLTHAALSKLVGRDFRASVVVADLSFISLTHVFAALKACAEPDADFVVLVKPQFEVGRTGVKEGIVTNPALREDAVNAVLWSAWDHGLGVCGILSSPILGSAGNHEYVLWLRADSEQNPTQWSHTVHSITGA
jgi:23S rRNA (cytidine1920-2'-O)/16S rRNA (cytidine1409-2'-O)-methyltransferase